MVNEYKGKIPESTKKILEKMMPPILSINGGNYSEHLQKGSYVYAKLLCGQGKDLYLLGTDSDWSYAIGLTKKTRKRDKEGEILDADDVKELLKIFPLCYKGVSANLSEIIGRYRLKPYTGEDSEKHLTTGDLEKILEGKPVEIFAPDS